MHPRLRNFIILLFILSGLSSLVFQTIWVRVISLAVGSTSAAMSIVLSIFFFGLALGSYLSGKYAQKLKNPLLAYGILEGIIGVYGVALFYILLNFHYFLAWLPLTGDFALLGTFLKFAIVFVLLMLPTTCMGATLPLLIRLFVESKTKKNGHFISLLYGINTLGAVLGAFLASFVFIPIGGLLVSNLAAAFVNISVLFASFYLSKKYLKSIEVKPHEGEVKNLSLKNTTPVQKYLLMICMVSGFSSISAEVVWNKYLGIYFGTNIYGLGIILSIFLLGIALGSLTLSFFYEKITNKKSLHLTLVLLAILSLLTTSLLLNIAPVLSSIIVYYTGGYFNLLTIKSFITAVLILPSTTVFGGLLPLTIDLLASSEDESASNITGSAYAINTIGAILGSCLAGLVFIPKFGSSFTITLGIILLVLTTIPLIRVFIQKSFFQYTYFGLLILISCGTIFYKNIDFRNIIKSAYFQSFDPNSSLTEILKYYTNDQEEFLLIVEGETAITSLSHNKEEGENYKDYFRLKTNGLNESIYDKNNLDNIPKYEGLLGALPYAFNRNPKSAFVVGYGGGYTVDFLTSLGIPNVYVAELEKGIIEAAKYVYQGNNPILARDNLNLKIEDARFVLAAKLYDKFDIIVSQPSHSWLSGVANLFTKEFFEIVQSNLSERGIYSQWLNLYNIDIVTLKSILKTFYTVFPHGHIFTNLEDQELIMLGANRPLQLSLEKLEALTKNRFLKERLSQLPFDSPASFLTNYTISREDLLPTVEGASINTDINVFAEVSQSRLFYSSTENMRPDEYLVGLFRGKFDRFIDEQTLKNKDLYYELSKSLYDLDKNQKFYMMLKHYEDMPSKTASDYDKLGYLTFLAKRNFSSLKYFKKSFEIRPNSYTLNRQLQVLLGSKEYSEVLTLAKKNSKYLNVGSLCYTIAAKQELGSLSGTEFRRFSQKNRKLEAECLLLSHKIAAKYYVKQKNFKKALYYLESFYAVSKNDQEVLAMLSGIYFLNKDQKRGADFSEYLATLKDLHQKDNEQLILYFESRDLAEDASLLKKTMSF